MTTKLAVGSAMAPKPHVVALDNPHGTNWRVIETGIVTNATDRAAGFTVFATFQCDEGWRADYLYREQDTLFSYGYGQPRMWSRGWTLGAN